VLDEYASNDIFIDPLMVAAKPDSPEGRERLGLD
jgi:hypothetical protein